MSRKIQGLVLLAALAATLTLATPAQAAPLEGWLNASGLFVQAWQWMARAGQGGTLPGGSAVKPRGTEGLTKAGPGSDPNGSHGAGTTVTSDPGFSDSGMGAAPNG
jgi:hypothetical protein